MANEITANKEYKAADNVETDDVPQGGDTIDNSYATKGSDAIPVVKDEAPVEQPNDARNPDSDGALGTPLLSPITSPLHRDTVWTQAD